MSRFPGSTCLALVLPLAALTAHAATIQTDKDVYFVLQPVVVTFSGMPGNAQDWVSVGLASDPAGSNGLKYCYTSGKASGTCTADPIQAPGDYEARAYFSNGTVIQARKAFKAIYPTPQIALDKPSYFVLDKITVSYSNFPGYPKDYVTVVPASASDGTYAQYIFSNGQKSGTMVFNDLPPGKYEARVHFNNQDAVVQARLPFTVGYPTTTIRTDKTQYQVNESISVTYANMPGYAKDYVTVVPAAAADSTYAQWFFTNGQKNGTMTFTGMTAAGQYEARVHYNNEDSTVRARYAFAVGSACTFSISPASANMPAAGGSGSVTVTASGSTCAWKASPSASWVAVTSGSSGTGNGTVSYTVASNTGASLRTATISVEGQTLTVIQAGATAPPPAGGNLLSNPGAESGPVSSDYSGLASISGWTTDGNVSICAYASTSCSGTLDPTSPGPSDRGNNFFGGGFAGSSSIWQIVDVSAWAAATDAATQPYTLSGWLGGYANQGDNVTVKAVFRDTAGSTLGTAQIGPVTAADRGNVTSLLARSASGTLPARTRSVTITVQFTRTDGSANDGYADNFYFGAGDGATATCTNTLNATTQSMTAGAATGTVAVTAAAGCSWKAISNATWITISGGASGLGNGTVNYAVAANTSASSRTGTLTIAGQTFTVTQAGAAAPGVPTISSISNADDGLGWFTPGSRLSIKGSQFGAAGNDATWPSSLGGATVEISDAVHMVNAPLSGITPDSITALVPFDLTGAQVQVKVRTSKGASDAYALPLTARSPHILTDNQVDGSGGAQATHLDGSGVSSVSPAQSGEVIDLHVLGLGTTLPLAEAGTAGGDGLPDTPFNSVSSVTATIGGMPAEVLSAVLEGVNGYRVRVGVPEPLVPGTYELQINCGNAASQPKIVIPVTSTWEVGQTAIIGAEGGDLSYGSLTVSIPAASLSQPTSLSIYRLPGAGGTADSFAVDGIPRTGRGPVTLKFHGQTAAADRPLIEISDMLAFGLGPHAVAPTADGADLTVTLPAPEPVDLAPAGAPAVRAALRHWSFGEDPTLIKIKPPFVPGYETVLGACGPEHDSTSLIFEIHYPTDGSVLREWVQTLGDALKKACLLLQDQNVGGLAWKDRTWPISVNITGLAAKYRDVWGLEGGILWGKSTQNIDVNILHFKSADDLTYQVPTVAHELFHVLQNLYCTYSGPYMATNDNPFWLWYMEAASTWFERRVAGDTWIPTTVKPDIKLGLQQSNNYQYIGVGLGRTMGPDDRVLDRESVQNRGYGWSMFLEYLGQSGKPADIGAQFMSNGKGGFNDIVGPQQSLRNFYGPDLGNKWRGYVDKFATGQIYTSAAKGFRNFPDADSIAGMSQRFNVAARVGVDEKEFQGSIAPLAAKFYRVNFTGMQAAAGARYRFTLKGPDTLRVSVYSQDRQTDGTTQLSLQASDVNPYLTDLATTLAANRTTLVVVVINPADGGDEATFSLKVEPVKQFANLTNLDFILDSGCKADTPTPIDCSINTGGSVTWSGNDFKSSYSGSGVVFSVEGSLNADRTKILSLKFIYQADYTLNVAGGQQWTWSAIGAATNYPNYPSNLHPAWSLSTTSCKFETGPDSLGDLDETVDVTDWSGTQHYVKKSSQQPLSLTITFH